MEILIDLKKEKNRRLNLQRDEELKEFVINDIFMNEDVIKMMAVKFNIIDDKEKVFWIDINNNTRGLTKTEFGDLIRLGSQKVEEIYFKYRKLKDELEKQI